MFLIWKKSKSSHYQVNNSTLIHTNWLSTWVTVLCKHGIKAVQAVGPAIPHNVALSSQLPITLKACEVFHVPGTTLCLRTLIRKNYLQQQIITSGVYISRDSLSSFWMFRHLSMGDEQNRKCFQTMHLLGHFRWDIPQWVLMRWRLNFVTVTINLGKVPEYPESFK